MPLVNAHGLFISANDFNLTTLFIHELISSFLPLGRFRLRGGLSTQPLRFFALSSISMNEWTVLNEIESRVAKPELLFVDS